MVSQTACILCIYKQKSLHAHAFMGMNFGMTTQGTANC